MTMDAHLNKIASEQHVSNEILQKESVWRSAMIRSGS